MRKTELCFWRLVSCCHTPTNYFSWSTIRKQLFQQTDKAWAAVPEEQISHPGVQRYSRANGLPCCGLIQGNASCTACLRQGKVLTAPRGSDSNTGRSHKTLFLQSLSFFSACKPGTRCNQRVSHELESQLSRQETAAQQSSMGEKVPLDFKTEHHHLHSDT